jgi:hypothetical protein
MREQLHCAAVAEPPRQMDPMPQLHNFTALAEQAPKVCRATSYRRRTLGS